MLETFYKDILYRGYKPEDGYIHTLNLSIPKRPISKFYQNIDNLIVNTKERTDLYHGVSIRKEKNGKAGTSLYSNVLFLDIDFHDYDGTAWDGLKEKAIEIIVNDIFLSQYCAVIDTGRGLHFYYLLPEHTYVDTFKNYTGKLMEYAEGVEFIQGGDILDRRVVNFNRVLRIPNTFNSKANKKSELMYAEPTIIDKDFLAYLKMASSPKKNTTNFSVAKAMELVGYEPVLGVNVCCPFPDHEDKSPSFRYYEETDTFWCFKCSQSGKRKMFDGIHFLTLMGREDLIPELKASVDVNMQDKYSLDKSGSMWVEQDKGPKLLANFLSNRKIEVNSSTHGRKVYIDLDDNVVEITDYPNNREIKKRYLQTNREFLLNCGESGFADLLTRFILKANSVDKQVIFNHGLNVYEYGKPLYYLNNRAYPIQELEPVSAVEPIDRSKKIYMKPDIDGFFKDLNDDGNYSHIIGFLWGVATIARDIIIKNNGMFPLLVATGIKESGKTLLARMILNMFGYDRSEELDTTSFALIKKLERYGSLPVHFDEFSNKKRELEHEELLKDLATSVLSVRERGNISQKTDKFVLQCPIIITGEKNITDAGMVSRSIILNLGKSPKKNYKSFIRWTNFVKNGELLSWLSYFLEKHLYSFREYMSNAEIGRERDKVKLDILNCVIDYLKKHKLLNYDINKKNIESILSDTIIYKNSISSDGYTEILSETLSGNFEPDNTPSKNFKLKLLCESFYFDLKHKVIYLNIPSLFEAYKLSVKDAYKKIPSTNEFKVNFLQSPDMVGFMNSRKRMIIADKYIDKSIEKRLHNVIVLKVSAFNYDYMRYILLYKFLPEYNNNISGLYDAVEDVLTDMSDNFDGFVDKFGSYNVI